MSDLQIETLQEVRVVYLTGILNALTVRQLEPQLSALVQADDRVVLHMGKVDFISSIGVWMLFSLQRKMKDREGRLILVAVPENVRDTLSLVGFSTVFRAFDSLADGLAFLNSPRTENPS